MIKNSNILKKVRVISLVLISSFSFMYGNTQIKSIDVYKNRTLINQELDLKKQSADLIGYIDLENIRFNLNKECKILDLDFKKIDPKKDVIINLIEGLNEKISQSENKKKALESNIKFMQGLKLQENQNINTLKQSSEFLVDNIAKSYNEIYSIEKTIKEYKKELNQLKKQSSINKFTKLDYKIDCKNSDKITVSYPSFLISINRFNTINYNTLEKKIEFKSNAYITQNSGVDFKDIVINFYSGNYFNRVKPYMFLPEYLDITPDKPIPFASDMIEQSQTFVRTKALRKNEVSQYTEFTTKSAIKVLHVDLKTSKKTKIELSNDAIDAKNYIEIDGYSSSNGFYKVDFKSKKFYEQNFARLYIDNIYIGKNSINEIKKDKQSSIYFGTSSFIDVKKELIKDMKEEPFFSINKLKTQKLWRYEITNSSKEKEKISLVERVPVSKHEDIKVKLIGKTKYTKLDKNGKIYFDIILKPKEKRIIEFGYEIEKPAKSK